MKNANNNATRALNTLFNHEVSLAILESEISAYNAPGECFHLVQDREESKLNEALLSLIGKSKNDFIKHLNEQYPGFYGSGKWGQRVFEKAAKLLGWF